MARTVAIAGTFALAASLAARSDAAHAAAHQACLQVVPEQGFRHWASAHPPKWHVFCCYIAKLTPRLSSMQLLEVVDCQC